MTMTLPTPCPVSMPARSLRRIGAGLRVGLASLLLAAPAALAAPASAAPAGSAAALDAVPAAVPTPQIAAGLFQQAPEKITLQRQEAPVPAWRALSDGVPLGLIGSTWELAGSTGYSGRPLDVLVALTPDGTVAGARLMRQNEPVLTLGISETDIAAYVDAFRGYNAAQTPRDTLDAQSGLPDVISRATVSTGVIRDGILRTARILAGAQGLGGGVVDRVGYAPADWPALVSMGALAHTRVTMAEAAQAFAAAKNPPTPSDAPFFEMWTGVIDTPTAGRNLLGQQVFTTLNGTLGPGQSLLAVFSQGLHSHRGTDWRQSGRFDRISISQGAVKIVPAVDDYTQISGMPLKGVPDLKERSVFRINTDPDNGGINLREPFTVTVTATRPAADGTELMLPMPVQVSLPQAFQLAEPAPEVPLWQEFWLQKQPQIAIVGVMLGVLGLILLGQEWLVRRPRLWRRVRLTYLATTLFVLGWGLNAQLSVVQVIAFLQALLNGFRWETFLIAPLIFVLWSAVALGMLFWGRGVFCGWLCPFGALQELTNQAAQKLGVRQIKVPQALHERLWVIKYTAFVGLVALSFYSMEKALIAAEIEPFKTAISMRFMRAWPFVLYAVAILGAGLFVERFFCRYMCPLGAGLAIPAKLKIFDWLRRRPQCGRECRLCETKCPVGAIDALGRINSNECVMCLRCQVIMDDPTMCPVLIRRTRSAPRPPGSGPAPATPPAPPPLRPTQYPSDAHDGAADAVPAQPPAFQSQKVTP